MMAKRTAQLLVAAAQFSSLARGQYSGWDADQVNSTICTWKGLRASAIKDTAYMDGGYLYWVAGINDGTYGSPEQDDNPLGLIYTLNFSQPFDTTPEFNYSTVLVPIHKVAEGNSATNIAPNYYDGAILANDHEFFLYGGLLRRSGVISAPDADEIIGYGLTEYGADKEFFPGVFNEELPENITRYVTYGGAANAPSENKAWYFGGMRAPSAGPIFSVTQNDQYNPTNVSNTLITLDMEYQRQEVWTNVTLPPAVKSRANPELIWVPVGEQGILVAVGGVTYPDYNNPSFASENAAQSEIDSVKFMTVMDIYDVASGKWYKQPTSGDGPGQLTLGCAVLATAQDFSSFNIYYYGGYDGITPDQDFSDDVWVLSLPSFVWTKLYTGKSSHGRAGHKCVKPYPDQMMVVGGYGAAKSLSVECLEGVIQVFNLTSGTWLSTYNPEVWSEYRIPDVVLKEIGGTATGGASATSPKADGWETEALGAVFAKVYDASKLTSYYPYSPASESEPPRGDIVDNGGGGGGTPSWVAPVLGVVLGLVFLTAIVVAILLYRRRKLLQRNGGTITVSGTDENGHRILSWIRGQNSDKAPTVTTEDTPIHMDDLDSRPTPMSQIDVVVSSAHEAPDTVLFELMDTSPRVELSDTGLTPVEVINKHTYVGSRHQQQTSRGNTGPLSPDSYYSGTNSQDHASELSAPQPVSERADSPALAGHTISSPSSGSIATAAHSVAAGGAQQQQQLPPSRSAIVSGVSALSERDKTHLRNLSEASVSSAGGPPVSPGFPLQLQPLRPELGADIVSPSVGPGHLGPLSPELPVSPPTAEERDAVDYISAGPRTTLSTQNLQQHQQQQQQAGGSTSSPERRSVFREDTGDLDAPAAAAPGSQQPPKW